MVSCGEEFKAKIPSQVGFESFEEMTELVEIVDCKNFFNGLQDLQLTCQTQQVCPQDPDQGGACEGNDNEMLLHKEIQIYKCKLRQISMRG